MPPYIDENGCKVIDYSARITHLTNLAIQKKHHEFRERKEEVAVTMAALRDDLIARGLCSSPE